ncbi:outer membrane protein TolC [Geobacter argillaceus]|uniref:Outer membrane protein TolC n=2 Tax=Geobacter argillaceus TaxID=345631 RepID=A0A562VPS1_9BACT|nr:outer membrane protein TolC [Geobacter argillaceus]
MKINNGIIVITCAILLKMNIAHAADTSPPENLSILVATALDNNPELKSSTSRWQMFKNRIAQARTFDDPMLMLKIQNGIVSDPFNFRKDPMTQKVIGISQQLPFWGKRDLKGEVATKEAESYRWQVEERKLELRRMVVETYYQIYFTDKSLGIVDKNLNILGDFITLAETKYSVGQGVQQDVFKAQVERSKMLDMRISLEQQRKSLQANLNTLLYRPAETPIGAIPDFDIRQITQSPEELRTIAYENRPLLKSLSALIEKGKAGHKLAEKESYPDFNVSLEYMQRDRFEGSNGDDMYSLGVTFNLPVQKERRQAMVAESSSEISMANEELNSAKNSINLSVSDITAQLERRKKLIELYKAGIIPQSEQSLESAAIGYRVNKVDFLTLLDSRMTLFNYERELYESQAEYMMKIAQLEAVVGTDLVTAPSQQSLSPLPATSETPQTPAVVQPTVEHTQHH